MLIGSWAALVALLHAEGLDHCRGDPRGQSYPAQGALCLDNGIILQQVPWHLDTCTGSFNIHLSLEG